MYRYIDRSKAFKKAEITIKQKNWEPNDRFAQRGKTLPDSGLYWNTDDNTMYDASTRKPIEETKGLITNPDEANAFRDKWFEGSSTVDSQGNVLQAGQIIPPDQNIERYIYDNNYKNEDLNTNPLLNDPSFVDENGVRSFSAVPFENIVKFIRENPFLLEPTEIYPLDESEKEKFNQAKDQVRKENEANANDPGNYSYDPDSQASQTLINAITKPTTTPSPTATAVPSTATATTVPPTATASPTATTVPTATASVTGTPSPTSIPLSPTDDPGNYYNNENFVQTLNAAISLNNAIGTPSPTATVVPPTATPIPTATTVPATNTTIPIGTATATSSPTATPIATATTVPATATAIPIGTSTATSSPTATQIPASATQTEKPLRNYTDYHQPLTEKQILDQNNRALRAHQSLMENVVKPPQSFVENLLGIPDYDPFRYNGKYSQKGDLVYPIIGDKDQEWQKNNPVEGQIVNLGGGFGWSTPHVSKTQEEIDEDNRVKNFIGPRALNAREKMETRRQGVTNWLGNKTPYDDFISRINQGDESAINEIVANTQTPSPTATAVPPTATPSPTATAVPPTATPSAASTTEEEDTPVDPTPTQTATREPMIFRKPDDGKGKEVNAFIDWLDKNFINPALLALIPKQDMSTPTSTPEMMDGWEYRRTGGTPTPVTRSTLTPNEIKVLLDNSKATATARARGSETPTPTPSETSTPTPTASVTSTRVSDPTKTPQSFTDRFIDSARGGIRAVQNVFKENYGGYLDSDKTLSDLSVRPTSTPSERKTPDPTKPMLRDFPVINSQVSLDPQGENIQMEAINNAATRIAKQTTPTSTPSAEDVAANLLANQFASQGSRSAQQSRGPERTATAQAKIYPAIQGSVQENWTSGSGDAPPYGTKEWDKWARAKGMTVEYPDPSQLIPPEIDYNKTEMVDNSGNWDDPDLTPTQWHPNTPPTVKELSNNPDSTSNRIRATSQAKIDNFWNSQSNTPAASPTKTPKPTSTPKPISTPKPTTTPLTRSFERKASSMTTKEPFFLFSHNTKKELTESEKYHLNRQELAKSMTEDEKIEFFVLDDLAMLQNIILKDENESIIKNWIQNSRMKKGMNNPDLDLHTEWNKIVIQNAYQHYKLNPEQYWLNTEDSLETAISHPVLYQTGIKTLVPPMRDMTPVQKSNLSRDEKITLSNIIGVSTESIDEKLSKSFMVNEPELMTNSEQADLSERQISASLSNNQIIDGLAKLFGISPTEAEQKIAAAQFHPFGGV